MSPSKEKKKPPTPTPLHNSSQPLTSSNPTDIELTSTSPPNTKKKSKSPPPPSNHANTLIPFSTSNPLSKLLYSWQTQFMWLGYRRPLQISDLYALPPHLEAQWNGEAIERTFKHHSSTLEKESSSSMTSPPPVDTSLTTLPSYVPSLSKVLFQVYGKEWMLGGLFQFISIATPLISPYFLKLLLDYLNTLYEASSNPSVTSKPSIGTGVGYVFAMLGLQLTSTLANAQFFTMCMKLGMQVRSGLVTTLYRKALRLSLKARTQTYHPGKIINIISTDTVRLDFVTPYLHMLWSSPLQIVVILGLLIQLLGPSALAGFALMVIFLPFQGIIMKNLSTYRKQVQTQTDARMKIMHEVLQGIKIIKLFTWEPSFVHHLESVRDQELKLVRKISIWRSGINALSQVIPALTAIVVFAVYANVGNTLTASVVFTSLAYFNLLRLPLMFLPMMLSFAVDAKVALNRVALFLNAEEQLHPIVMLPWDPHLPAIECKQVSLTWTDDDPHTNNNHDNHHDTTTTPPYLSNLSLSFPVGALVAIVGRVGQGKSSLLSGIVGEMKKVQGEIVVRGKLSYCPQQPWIQNASVKDNILFGLPFDEVKYQRAIHLACLKRDLEQLPDGELTEIGEKGINLSGGQKARINLARAIYFDADIVLLDDPLSAVDAHVGRFLFQTTLLEALKGKTRLLVTHALHYVPQCDYIVFMQDGQVVEQGTYSELMGKVNGVFAQQMLHFGGLEKKKSQELPEGGDSPRNIYLDQESGPLEFFDTDPPTGVVEPWEQGREDDLPLHDIEEKKASSPNTQETPTHGNEAMASPKETKRVEDVLFKEGKEPPPLSPVATIQEKSPPQKLIKEEERSTGKVELGMYLAYFRAAGGLVVLFLVVVVLVLGQVFRAGTDLWLAAWTNRFFDLSLMVYLGVYFAWGVSQTLFYIINGVQIAYVGVVASRNMHEAALSAVLKAPMMFFDTTPLGRITNRFSKDIDALDNNLTDALRMFASTLAVCVSTLCLIIGITPYFAIPTVPLLIVYYFIQKFYRSTSRELKRLDSITRSPVLAQFSESLTGIVTIRAYGEQERFSLQNQRYINANNRAYFLQLCAQRWLAIRIETIGSFLTFFAGLFGVFTQGSIAPSLIGLSLSNALQVTGVLNWCVRQASETEVQMNSVERIHYYMTSLPQEAATSTPMDASLSEQWPSQGDLEFRGVTLAYRPELPPVLHQVNLHLLPGEKVGVIGRTGAGKSSLIACLFRLVEVNEGEIVLDGVSLNTLGLAKVRSSLGIIPQDPVLFAGTLRANIDRFQEYSDQEVWDTLGRAGLKEYVQSLPLKLEFQITENGENLSVGQRQLMCLARTLLKKTKVLVLDEVTASVDAQTDAAIQRAIREELHACTILTIAHRLNTIMDYDKIAVMDLGRVCEFGSPKTLIQQHGSLFNALIDETGPTNAQVLRSLATK
ncbi:Multidrug resistance-associated protein 1 [Coelomomyces lativittatus]|nr:Multidrug resistance-associated protein 1 [Coelomomyces lativittatus]